MGLVFLFPGQGSQYVGMGRELAAAFPAARRALEQADEALGRPLSRLIDQGPEDELRLTWNTQPAILAVSVACLRALGDLEPLACAGHSLGEYAALVAAGALDYADALRTVEQRGRFMQEAVPLGVGSMAAVLGLEPERVTEICAQVSGPGRTVQLANDNCPGQAVISGHVAAVDAAVAAAKAAGAKRAVPLAVSAPFHCELMTPAAERLEPVLEALEIGPARFPVVANVDAGVHGDPASVARRLVEQVRAPVLWQGCVRRLIELGGSRFVEVGPGKVLAGLMRRIDRALPAANVEDPASLEAFREGL
jgi:[acyl-carrier-protein] S-malonyltransferase